MLLICTSSAPILIKRAEHTCADNATLTVQHPTGTFTGVSAVAWATVLPDDGKVISTDVKQDALDAIGRPVINEFPAIEKKIDFRLAPALEVLDGLIAGEAGTWDMARSSTRIRATSGTTTFGARNCYTLALVDGKAAVEPDPSEDEWKRERVEWIRGGNEKIFNDPGTDIILLNLGDRMDVAFIK